MSKNNVPSYLRQCSNTRSAIKTVSRFGTPSLDQAERILPVPEFQYKKSLNKLHSNSRNINNLTVLFNVCISPVILSFICGKILSELNFCIHLPLLRRCYEDLKNQH